MGDEEPRPSGREILRAGSLTHVEGAYQRRGHLDDDVPIQLEQLSARLDHLEQYLVRVGKKNGPEYTPTEGFVPAAPDVIDLARGGDTEGAIARYQESTGADRSRAEAVIKGL